MNALFLVMLVGAVVGAGVLLLVSVVADSPVSGAAALAQVDARRERGARTAGLTADQGVATAMVYGALALASSLPGAAVLIMRRLRFSGRLSGEGQLGG